MRTELLNDLDRLIYGHPRTDRPEAWYHWEQEWKDLRARIAAGTCENCERGIRLKDGVRCRHFALFVAREFSCGHFEPKEKTRG